MMQRWQRLVCMRYISAPSTSAALAASHSFRRPLLPDTLLQASSTLSIKFHARRDTIASCWDAEVLMGCPIDSAVESSSPLVVRGGLA